MNGCENMNYKIMIHEFEGPLDLLLHLIKESDIEILDISVEEITKQYMDYIDAMEELNLNIASEYLVMAAELLEMKSRELLPRKKQELEDDYEEDPKARLIERLLEYKRYKEVTPELKELEENRKQVYTTEPLDLKQFQQSDDVMIDDISLDDLLVAFQKFLARKELEKPLSTKVTKREYSVSTRSKEIKSILKEKGKISFDELFEVYTKDYFVVTFLSILDLAKKQECQIRQDHNFESIEILAKEGK